jgi:hypothetical protein
VCLRNIDNLRLFNPAVFRQHRDTHFTSHQYVIQRNSDGGSGHQGRGAGADCR